MIVFYPDDVWYAGVQESDLEEIFTSHIVGGRPGRAAALQPGKPGANKVSEAELAEIKRAYLARARRPPRRGRRPRGSAWGPPPRFPPTG